MAENKALSAAAKRIVEAARRNLAAELPELLPAIYLMPTEECERTGPLWTDGTVLFYHPETVARDYLARKKSVSEQLLHVLVHGLLGHFDKRRGQSPRLFDAAADVKAADFIDRLGCGGVRHRKWPDETKKLMNAQKELSLETMYLTPQTGPEAAELVRAAKPLESDAHAFWGIPQSRQQQGSGAGPAMGSLSELWESVRQQVAAGLNANGKGELAGELGPTYSEAKESGVSYREFLRRFLEIRERVEIDPDSIDRIWYHIGLDLTGDVPIVEPEELREDRGELRLAVALDTSGSCQGEVMKEFLGELLAILRDSGGPRVELTLLQCDAELQSVSVLTREDDAERIMEGFQTFGCGGTDFRPVFDYVNRWNESPEEEPFRGLLYLSDGWGDFPEEAPDYPVAFLLPQEQEWEWDWDMEMMPDWVVKVRTTEDGRLKIEEAKQ